MCMTPSVIKNPVFPQLFPTRQAIVDEFRKFKPAFSPEFIEIVLSNDSPTLEELKEATALEPTKNTWGIYLLFMEITDIPPGLYTGSGTNSDRGIGNRMRDYERGVSLPRQVKQYLDLGFDITHHKVLMSTTMPSPEDFTLCRAFLRLLEATIIFGFWTVHSIFDTEKYQYVMERASFWDRDELEWKGLNANTPLAKDLGVNANLMPEEREEKAKMAKERKRENSRRSANWGWTGER